MSVVINFNFKYLTDTFRVLEYKLSYIISNFITPRSHNEVGSQELHQGRRHPALAAHAAHPRAGAGGGAADHQRDGERHHGLQVLRDRTARGHNTTKGRKIASLIFNINV